jgi:hypothetical protein
VVDGFPAVGKSWGNSRQAQPLRTM